MAEEPLVWTHALLPRAAEVAVTAGVTVGARHLVAHLNARDLLADGEHVAGHLVARHDRKLNEVAIGALAHQEIVIAHAGGAHADEHPVASRLPRRGTLRTCKISGGPMPPGSPPASKRRSPSPLLLFHGLPEGIHAAAQEVSVLPRLRCAASDLIDTLEIPWWSCRSQRAGASDRNLGRFPRRHMSTWAEAS